MITGELVAYITRELQQGKTKTTIQKELLSAGWDNTAIEEALQATLGRQGAPSSTTWWHFILELLFRLGFASIFLINAVTAWVSPQDFMTLLKDSAVITLFGSPLIPMWLIAGNDLVLGLFILMGKWKPVIYAWAGVWFLVIVYTKVAHLFFT